MPMAKTIKSLIESFTDFHYFNFRQPNCSIEHIKYNKISPKTKFEKKTSI